MGSSSYVDSDGARCEEWRTINRAQYTLEMIRLKTNVILKKFTVIFQNCVFEPVDAAIVFIRLTSSSYFVPVNIREKTDRG